MGGEEEGVAAAMQVICKIIALTTDRIAQHKDLSPKNHNLTNNY